jgi:hypothetical protein
MAIQIRKASKAYIGQVDFSDHIPNVNVDSSVEAVDVTSIADGTRKYSGGLFVGTMDFEMFEDYDANEVDAMLNMIDPISSGVPMRLSVPISVAADTTVANGTAAYLLNANILEHKKQWTIGEIAKVNIAAKGAGELMRGGFLTVDQLIASSTNGTGVQLGSLSTSQKMYAFLHYTGGISPSGITITIQHSSTQGGAYSTTSMSSSSFTALSGSAGYQILAITASANITDTWWRASWTYTSGSNVYVTVSAGIR